MEKMTSGSDNLHLASNGEYTSENIRYLLWRAGYMRSEWLDRTAIELGVDPQRAEDIMRGEQLAPEELVQLSQVFNEPVDRLYNNRLLEIDRVDVLAHNLRHLTDILPHGYKVQLSSYLGIHPVTLSKWIGGQQKPSKKYLSAIREYFGIPSEFDLANEAIFLSIDPSCGYEQRLWTIEQLVQIKPLKIYWAFPQIQSLLNRM
jgi:transcriptional regulator with XRE-family HTH domain